MRNFTVAMLFTILGFINLNAQNIVKGIVINGDSEQPLQGVSVKVNNSNISTISDAGGAFTLQGLTDGRQIIVVSLNGYETQNFPVQLSGKTVDLGTIMMFEDVSEDQDLSTITITDDELNDDTSAADNISGLLQASRDIYSRTAAFEWSGSFYRIKGLDSENGKVLINGIEMNKLYNGRPQWSNWGGLNDVLRNQEFSNGLTPSNYTFGGVLGSTNISTRASAYRKGGRISYASSNRSYSHRLMATYATGLMKNGWALTASGSRRAGNEGYVDGTFYDANSIFLAIEKQLSNKHALNLTVIAAENERGKSAPHTQEVYDLKGIRYNEYWGYQNGKMRNSRVRRIYEPIVMLNHYWNISDNTSLNTNVSYQFGEIGNSRIDFNAGNNPSPTYYQNLPSYEVDRGNLGLAYEKQQAFINNGQLNWNALYDANITNANAGLNNAYVLYEDRNDDKQFTINTILNSELNDNITLNGKLQYSKFNSDNFANILDLLGGNGYLDINRFSNVDDPGRQNDLLNPNRVVTVGDKFRYNYELESEIYGGFAQAQFKYNKVDFYVAGDVSRTTHQRNGLYQNGRFVDNSLGKSEKLNFTNFGVKAGATYKISGRHLLDFNGAYLTKAPTIRNTFSNPRESNAVVIGLTDEKILSTDASYIFRSPLLQAKVTGYYTKVQDATDIGFFFLQSSTAEAFIQEVVTGIDKKHFGAEIGLEYQVTPTIKLKGAANIGQYTYDNNPNVYLATENTQDAQQQGFVNGVLDLGKSNLKDYRLASGPQKAYSFGFEYRDPDYWWVGATANYLDETFIDVGPITRTSAFFKDSDGLPFNNYDPAVARELLQQEEFDSYLTVNVVGGKSWKIGDYYVGLFASVTNLFDKEFKTGGFEQTRRGDFNSLSAEAQRETPLFGSKYWYGRGTSYFLNVYFRF
ncbi:TonB-dependent receptor [Tenacibaculum holothuriorum]|uniref:TonB-dependent receptor n=1 Tax=Tenacibaculum holothuriorum TaxID=1635173 RepID=A0A1Y2PBQ1_9FLAO|nr:TonB-dependent receptor [Tenacibaculum holothuriorum]OSY87179.1 TonB-dependent receptor [Tenacibaculum holothuriorum]